MLPDNISKMPIVFIHGLWLHAESWNPWIEFFNENGYDAILLWERLRQRRKLAR
jgi:pimeloyl-ACP methyl ester carboxylesterase